MHNSRTTTSPHNPLYVLHRWYWMPQSHTWQPLSMCCQNSIRSWPENSPVCNWGIQYHLYTAWCLLPDIQVSIYCTVYVLFVKWAISEVNYMHVVSQQGYIMFVGTVMNICWVCSVKKKKYRQNYFGILLYHMQCLFWDCTWFLHQNKFYYKRSQCLSCYQGWTREGRHLAQQNTAPEEQTEWIADWLSHSFNGL